MDAKSIGSLIAKLRKKQGLTQVQLAEKLKISDKAVSRWENGSGFPEVTQFPALASIFGVTVDYIMSGERKGITIAGNIIADIVKSVDCYPKMGMLANISDVKIAVGGCAPNTGIDLIKIDRNIPISVIGKISDDEHGRYILSQLQRYNIDTSGISYSQDKPTSFSDVVSVPTGERSFFHFRGSNAQFSPDDIDISLINSIMLHIGYIHLLDCFDQSDEEYGTVMARFLHNVQESGIKTSIDVVSDSEADYKAKIIPALKYCNFAFLNEIESSMITELEPYNANGTLNIDNIKRTMKFIAECGVKEKIIVHCKMAGFCYNVIDDEFTVVPSINIPPEEIKGSVGAGDAFCAGCLFGIYNGYNDKQILEFAASAAACNLFSENSIDGMLDYKQIIEIPNKYGWRSL